MKEYSIFPKAPWFKPHHQIDECDILDTHWEMQLVFSTVLANWAGMSMEVQKWTAKELGWVALAGGPPNTF